MICLYLEIDGLVLLVETRKNWTTFGTADGTVIVLKD